MSDDVSVSREIEASADLVYDLVSDLPRMGEWSDENTGGTWVGAATGPAAGARFRGSNRNGWHRWMTQVTVTDASRGERFAFDVDLVGIPISRWAYEFEPTEDGGCRVTESWTDRRPGWFVPIGRLATGVEDRAEHSRSSMAHTLAQVAAAAEGDA